MSRAAPSQATGKSDTVGIASRRAGKCRRKRMMTTANTIATRSTTGTVMRWQGGGRIAVNRNAGRHGKNPGIASASSITIRLNPRGSGRETIRPITARAKINAIGTPIGHAQLRPGTGRNSGAKVRAEPNRTCRANAIVIRHDGLRTMIRKMSGGTAATDSMGATGQTQPRREHEMKIGGKARKDRGRIARTISTANGRCRRASAARTNLGRAKKAHPSRIARGMRIDLRT